MATPFKTWTVLPHGRLREIAPNILTVVGDLPMPVGEVPRRMTVVRLADGKLVIFSALSLDEDEMAALEAYGTPRFLIVPSPHHRMDILPWKTRYPGIAVIAPPGAVDKIADIVPVEGSGIDLGDDEITLVTVPGTGGKELALEVAGADGLTLVLNDVVANVKDEKGIGGFMLRLMHFAGDEPQVPTPVKYGLIHNKTALARQLRYWASLPGLTRILVAHGAAIESDCSAALTRLAESLD